MKKDMNRKRFADISEVKQKSKEALEGIQKDEYKKRFQQWKNHSNKIISVNGGYFKSD